MVCTHGDTFESPVSRNQQKANFPFNLKMKNILYLFTDCHQCHQHYLGHTTNKYKNRFYQCKSNLNVHKFDERGLCKNL